MRFSLGNFKETPLKDILQKGMRYFGGHSTICHTGQDVVFNTRHVSKTFGLVEPTPIEEILG
jgi:hypothetical protein